MLTAQHGSPVVMVGIALLVFPKLALGLSGFETDVAVMTHVEDGPDDTEERPAGRIQGTKRLLTAAALIMSVFLITSSVVTTLLIAPREFEPGGQVNGRALAYLAHEYLGRGCGTVYDLPTVAIVWVAGASAMAGVLNLVPRYLPRYGMGPGLGAGGAPTGSGVHHHLVPRHRPVQGERGCPGRGVRHRRARGHHLRRGRRDTGRPTSPAAGAMTVFAVVAAIFTYTTLANVVERPEGMKIGACFIAGILLVSFLSRLTRAFELRVTDVLLDDLAQRFIRDCARRGIRLIANEPGNRDDTEYREKSRQIRQDHNLPLEDDVVFVEVTVRDPSDFETAVEVHGEIRRGHRVMTLESSAVPNALAALMLHIRDRTGQRPHIYFEWSEGNPIANLWRYLLFGVGEVASVTREVLREAEPDPTRRPHVPVG